MGVKPLTSILIATGLVLVSLNLALGAYATGQVPAAVEEAVAMKAKDDICDSVSNIKERHWYLCQHAKRRRRWIRKLCDSFASVGCLCAAI